MVEACTLGATAEGATSAVDDSAVDADGTALRDTASAVPTAISAVGDAAVDPDDTATAVDDTASRDTTVPTAARSARAARLFDELDPPAPPVRQRQRVRNRTWGKFTLTHEV